MPYTPNSTWVDGSGGGTPISAARLNNVESGVCEDVGHVHAHGTASGSRPGDRQRHRRRPGTCSAASSSTLRPAHVREHYDVRHRRLGSLFPCNALSVRIGLCGVVKHLTTQAREMCDLRVG